VKLYFARPRELTGGMDEPSGACGVDAAGTGFEGGFCAGLCAKAGESGPATRSAAINMARRDLAASKTRRSAPQSKPDRFLPATAKKYLVRPHKVVMTILFLEILSLRDVVFRTELIQTDLILTDIVERALNRRWYTWLEGFLPGGRKIQVAWLRDRSIQENPSQF